MRKAMAVAELGDDVFGEDPTVNALEERGAFLLGKEAGLFVASGTMGNLVSLVAHLGRGTELIAGAGTHVVDGEAAGHAVVVGASARSLPTRDDGTMDLHSIDEAFRDPGDFHEPTTGLVVLENTHALSMGQPLTAKYTAEVAAIAHAHGVPLHIDGARLFDAAVSLGLTAQELAGPADSISFCLSKSLACPVGSIVVGSAGFIERARRARKLLGGGMRQAGILAAAGLIALRPGPDGMIERLAEDHANARRLAQGLVQLPGVIALDPDRVRTNFVIFGLAGAANGQPSTAMRTEFLARLATRGVLMIQYPGGLIRAVTHYGVTEDDVDAALAATSGVLSELVSQSVHLNATLSQPSAPAASMS
jgi:threonine aldolase